MCTLGVVPDAITLVICRSAAISASVFAIIDSVAIMAREFQSKSILNQKFSAPPSLARWNGPLKDGPWDNGPWDNSSKRNLS